MYNYFLLFIQNLMFFSVFSAVLLALLVYRFLIKSTKEQKETILWFIRWVLVIWLLLAIVGGVIALIYNYRHEIANILLFILWLAAIGLPIVLWMLFISWRKFKKRKELWLIKDWVKQSDFSDKFEKSRYQWLTQNQKLIEDRRANKSSVMLLWGLVAIPLLLVVWVIILGIFTAVK